MDNSFWIKLTPLNQSLKSVMTIFALKNYATLKFVLNIDPWDLHIKNVSRLVDKSAANQITLTKAKKYAKILPNTISHRYKLLGYFKS